MTNAFISLNLLEPQEFTALVRKNRPLLRPAQAAAYLDVSIRTLESWRASGHWLGVQEEQERHHPLPH